MIGFKQRFKKRTFTGSASIILSALFLGCIQGVKLMRGICILTALALLAATPILLWAAEDGAALFENKCAMCHGAKGEGNTEANMPAVKGTSMTVEKLVTYLTKGDPSKTIHADPVTDLTEEQAKAIAEYVKQLK
jgi:cytochrome c553